MKSLSCGIAIYNELHEIKKLLPTLQNEFQDYDIDWVFVLNHESETVRRILIEYLNLEIPSATVIENQSNNLGFARQLLLKNARNEFLYLTDPDIEIKSGSVIELLNSIEKLDQNIIGVGGPQNYQSTNPFLMRTFYFMNRISKLFPFSFQTQNYSSIKQVDHLPTCHLVLSRDKALAIGGFSAHFGRCGEDLDFSHRAFKNNFQFLFLPIAKVDHWQNFSTRQWLFKMLTYGRIQIFTQKLNLRLGLRLYRLLPFFIFTGGLFFTIAFPQIAITATTLLLILSLFQPGLLGFALTVLAYSLGEFFEVIAPIFARQNEVRLLALTNSVPGPNALSKMNTAQASKNQEALSISLDARRATKPV